MNNGNSVIKKGNLTPVPKPIVKPSKKMYRFILFGKFLLLKYCKIKYVDQIFAKTTIVSLEFIIICPKKIGFKKQSKKTILPIFLLARHGH